VPAARVNVTKPRLGVVVGSTRPGRLGIVLGEWALERATLHEQFTPELVDLAEWALPMLDEPHHPRERRYVHDHTKAWSHRIDELDAFVFVTPEYNHGPNGALKNAMDFLHQEWAYKPLGFVAYGGAAGGVRAVQVLRQVALSLKLYPLFEAVYFPRIKTSVANGVLNATPHDEIAYAAMLAELARIEESLRPLRKDHAPAGH
jgi:NAD(P)H-dependent FMN reductase